MSKLLKFFLIFSSFVLSLLVVAWIFLGPTRSSDQVEVFVVPQGKIDFDAVHELGEQKFIKSEGAFRFILDTFFIGKFIEPGGYRLGQNMNAWQVLKKVTAKPDLVWVTISFCARKEQVGEKLAEALGWNQEVLDEWSVLYKSDKSEYFEGVYYPDTYLIPTDESEVEVAQRFINRFNEKFTPLADEFIARNIKWTTGLKIASLIAREAAGTGDMKLISGIIWNRLDKGMLLQIDATMQYTLGKNEDGGWWGNINLDQKQSDSPYNSYRVKGLPPTPICSPSIDAIDAALNPEETECLYYLHDKGKEIHCAKTYEEHKENIEEYL
ncbi:endolytic transglycosylase MltG [Patescibacteria group bacterium]